ncbi:MAG: hypothetical protein Kow00121_19340 [Elainellaceae cyanobacterium]
MFTSKPVNNRNNRSLTIDPKLPFLGEALDRQQAQSRLAALFPAATCSLAAIHLIRHKPGRRCLIEYDLIVETPTSVQTVALIGKVRAKGLDRASYELQRALWNQGFAADSADGISVPEPIGIISEWQMWLQRKVPGTIATDQLLQTDGVALAHRIAEAAYKLHQTQIPASRHHTMTDELRILHERLPLVSQQHPEWRSRIEQVLDQCDRLGAAIPEPLPCGIHRDFYGDQIIVDGDRLYLLDLDLYCESNPALDVGNFMGHITEYSLRKFGNPDALGDREAALQERFIQLAGIELRPAIEAYALLTLVRHIYISTQFPERRYCTESLLELSEQRLSCLLRFL